MEKAPKPPNPRASAQGNSSTVVAFPSGGRRRDRRNRERRATDEELREFREAWPRMMAMLNDYAKLRLEFNKLRETSAVVHSNCVLAKKILRGDE